jgi:sulfite exporter TauE/SafE
VGYAGLGALAAASMQGLGWLTVQSVTLRPLWTFLHIAAIVLGLLLLWRARQPPWLETLGSFLWTRAQSLGLHRGAAPGLVGMLWALLPCGLLYSAVMVSALAGSVAGGAVLMALFALGSGITMLAGPWLWLRLAARIPPAAATGDWGVRLAGAALAASAAWALWMGLVHDAAPWCVVV